MQGRGVGTADLGCCEWCRLALATTRSDAKFCSRRCRQSAFRCRRLTLLTTSNGLPGRFGYADPPYPGFSKKYYGGQEVNHRCLIASLVAGSYTGWALSTHRDALRDILPLMPPETVVCSWVKPIGVSSRTRGTHNVWEPLLVVGGRKRQPGVPDMLVAQPARGGGDLMGRKPLAFCAWLFQVLGMEPSDTFEDWFPGTGVVTRAWLQASSRARGDGQLSFAAVDDASLRTRNYVSSGPGFDDVSLRTSYDASLTPASVAYSGA